MKLLLFDLDGTLLRSDKTISDRTLKAINKCRKQGVGSRAARACFALHDGLWEVKPAYGSESAKRFWQRVITEYAPQACWRDGGFVFDTQA